MSATPAGIIFDAYGTLFDVDSVTERLEGFFPGKGTALSQRWRQKQIDYALLRTLSQRYADFWDVTGDSLEYACEFEGVALTPQARQTLLDDYERLPTHREVPAALAALRDKGVGLAVLSNANSHMLKKALAAAGIEAHFAHVLSVETVRKFKTAPETYELGTQAFGAAARDLVFVSSNGWDVAGATWFGFRTFWVNRKGAPRERLGVAPSGEGRSLDDLAAFAGA